VKPVAWIALSKEGEADAWPFMSIKSGAEAPQLHFRAALDCRSL